MSEKVPGGLDSTVEEGAALGGSSTGLCFGVTSN